MLIMVRTLVCGLLFSGLTLGQGFGNLFDKAPPHIEEALRARVNLFYQSHVDGKFRQADQAVHEDSKDVFFSAQKPKYESFKILTISYEDDYKKAKVVVETLFEYVFLGVGRMKAPRPIVSNWKYDNNEWWWYVEPAKGCEESPFGCFQPGEKPPEEAAMHATTPEQGMANAKRLKAFLQTAVKPSKTEVLLPSGVPSSDEVTFTSRLDGKATLQLDVPAVPGLEVKFDKTTLEKNETAKLSISFNPPGKNLRPDITARVRVEPTGQVIEVRIASTAPPKQSEPSTPAAAPADKKL
jgi:hypothetical protein